MQSTQLRGIGLRFTFLLQHLSKATSDLSSLRRWWPTKSTEAATIPLAGITAAVALYRNLELPPPWTPASTPTPLVIYGVSSAVGSFALKFGAK